MAARGGRTHRHPVSDPRLLDVFAVLDSAGLVVDHREDVLVNGLGKAEEGAVAPIQLPEDPTLADGEVQRLPVQVDQNLFEGLVHVERLARDVLPVPHDAAVVHVEGQRRVGVQGGVGSGEPSARGHPRLGLGGAEVDESQIGIPATGNPHVCSAALLEG